MTNQGNMADPEHKKRSSTDIKDVLRKAIDKVKGTKENDVCRYLPVQQGGYMHHFTLKKMMTQEPAELEAMLNKHILSVDEPKLVPHRPRRPRGMSGSKSDVIQVTRSELEYIIGAVRSAGDPKIAAKLMPRQKRSDIKKRLIDSIRRDEVRRELYDAYVDLLEGDQEKAAALGASESGSSVYIQADIRAAAAAAAAAHAQAD